MSQSAAEIPAQGAGAGTPAGEGGDPAETPSRRRGTGGPGLLVHLLLRLVLQLLLLILLLLALVLGTQTGLRTALAVAEDLAPGLIRVGEVEGRVLGGMRLGDLEVHLPALDLRLGRLDLDWTPLAAFTGTLPIRRLQVQDLDLTLAPSEDQEREPIALPKVALPLGLEVGEVLVQRARVLQRGVEEPLVAVDRASLSGGLRGSALGLNRLEAELSEPRLSLGASGEAELRDLYPLGLDLRWELDQAPAVRLKGEGRLHGDLGRLVLSFGVSGSARARLEAEVKAVLEAPSWVGRVRLDGLDLPDFAAEAPAVELSGQIETQGDLDEASVTGTLEGRASDLPDFGHLEAGLDLGWADQVLSLRTLELRESVSGALVGLTAELDLRQSPETFQVQGAWERLRWPLSGDLLAESPEGRLEGSGTFAAYTYALSGALQGPGLPGLELALQGTGDGQGARIAPLEVRTLGGGVSAKGDLAWAPDLRWALEIEGQDLNPAALAQGIEDRLGLRLTTQGGLGGFQYRLEATTQGPGLPPAHLSARGTGDRRGAQVEALRLEALQGWFEAHGRATWDPRLEWEARLGWAGIDPGAFAAEWPGRLEGRIETQGALGPDGPHLSALIEGLQGELRGFRVAAAGRVELAGRSLRIQGLEASSGPSRLRANGALGEDRMDLVFDLASPDLGTLLPDARGRLEAQGRLGGTPKAPELRLDLSAEGVEVAGQGLGRLSGALDLVLTPDGPFKVQLDGAGLVAGGLRLDALQVRGEGAMPDHRLSLVLRGEPLSADLQAAGSLTADRSYQGRLNRLDLDSGPWGRWSLQGPMPLELAGSRVAAGPLCLRNGQGSGGCLRLDRPEPGRWDAAIDLDRLGAELILGVLPPNLAAEGAARVKGRFQGEGAVLKGSAVVEIPEGQVRVAQGRGAGEVLDLSGTRLTVDAEPQGIRSGLEAPLRGLGSLDGALELPGWRLDRPAWPDQPLSGRLRAQVDGLARVADLVPDLTGVRGRLDADLTLGGTLGRPELRGQASARGLGGEVPLIGLRLKDLDINLVATRDRLDLQGQGDLGGGRLELSGDGRLAPGGMVAQLRVTGERLRVADTKEYSALVSPRFDLELGPQGLRVRGELQVPEARIRPRSLPEGTVSASPDVVMVRDAGASAGPGLPLDLDVRLRLGDDVTMDAFGVRGRLTGDLRVLQEPGRQILGDGQLAIVDGLYRLSAGFGLAAEIGAPLTIEQGRLVFAKSPIGNPGLLLQAQREGGDTTAGVQVLGTLRDPKLAFFSESDPDMTQAEITTYLLTGVPPRREGGSEDRSLSVGTYVRPKLYMEYEAGLGDQKDKVKLRYDLTRRIEVQTETGESQGGDIFFKFER